MSCKWWCWKYIFIGKYIWEFWNGNIWYFSLDLEVCLCCIWWEHFETILLDCSGETFATHTLYESAFWFFSLRFAMSKIRSSIEKFRLFAIWKRCGMLAGRKEHSTHTLRIPFKYKFLFLRFATSSISITGKHSDSIWKISFTIWQRCGMFLGTIAAHTRTYLVFIKICLHLFGLWFRVFGMLVKIPVRF